LVVDRAVPLERPKLSDIRAVFAPKSPAGVRGVADSIWRVCGFVLPFGVSAFPFVPRFALRSPFEGLSRDVAIPGSVPPGVCIVEGPNAGLMTDLIVDRRSCARGRSRPGTLEAPVRDDDEANGCNRREDGTYDEKSE
jgi:hypothetical protein